jgi:Ca2+-binding EF-hand superfamily protein
VDESRLADADSDGDGKLSESELIGILSSMGPQTMMGGPRGGHGGPPPDVSEKFNQIDADNNGSITQEEFLASRPNEVTEEMASEMWSRLNSEGAESLTQKEFSEAMAAQGPPPGGGPRASGEESARNLADILLDSSDDEEDETELDMSTILSNIFTNYGQNQYKQRMDERLVAMMSASSGLNVTA